MSKQFYVWDYKQLAEVLRRDDVGDMAYMIRFGITIGILMLVTACAQPTLQMPNADSAEVEQERKTQESFVKNRHEPKGEWYNLPRVSKKEMQQRIRAVSKTILPVSEDMCVRMFGPTHQCHYDVEVDKKGPVNAWADGETVALTPAMIAFTETEEELAMVVAHELAHNILQHPSSQQQNTLGGAVLGLVVDTLIASQGFSTGGAFSNIGGEAARLQYSADFEREADYLAMYMLANAGYDLPRAVGFWRRMSAMDPDGMYGGSTHPSNPERFVALNATIREIEAKRTQNTVLLPSRKPDPS